MSNRPPTAKTARDAILARGKALYPHGKIDPDEMMQLGGRPYPTRIGELKEAGWSWEAVYDGIDPRPSYRLTSLVRGDADPVSWGLRARLGASTGLEVKPYGTSTLTLPEGVEARILARVEAVIREELAAAKVVVTGTVAPVVEAVVEAPVVTKAKAPESVDAWLTDILATAAPVPVVPPTPRKVDDDVAALFGF